MVFICYVHLYCVHLFGAGIVYYDVSTWQRFHLRCAESTGIVLSVYSYLCPVPRVVKEYSSAPDLDHLYHTHVSTVST